MHYLYAAFLALLVYIPFQTKVFSQDRQHTQDSYEMETRQFLSQRAHQFFFDQDDFEGTWQLKTAFYSLRKGDNAYQIQTLKKIDALPTATLQVNDHWTLDSDPKGCFEDSTCHDGRINYTVDDTTNTTDRVDKEIFASGLARLTPRGYMPILLSELGQIFIPDFFNITLHYCMVHLEKTDLMICSGFSSTPNSQEFHAISLIWLRPNIDA